MTNYVSRNRNQTRDICRQIIRVLEKNALDGTEGKTWASIGFQNGNGKDVAKEIDHLIKKAKRTLAEIEAH